MTKPFVVKLTIGLVAMVAWGALVVTGLAPVDPFVATLRDIVLGLGLFHATTTNPKGD